MRAAMALASLLALAVLLGAPIVHHEAVEACHEVAWPPFARGLVADGWVFAEPVDAADANASSPPVLALDGVAWAPPTDDPFSPGRQCSTEPAHRGGIIAAFSDEAPVAWGGTLATALPAAVLLGGMLALASLSLNDPYAPRRPRRPATAGRIAFAFVATLPTLAPFYSQGVWRSLGRPDDDDIAFLVAPLLPFAVVDDVVQDLTLAFLRATLGAYGSGTSGLDTVPREAAKMFPTWAGPWGTLACALAAAALWYFVQPMLMRIARSIARRLRSRARDPDPTG